MYFCVSSRNQKSCKHGRQSRGPEPRSYQSSQCCPSRSFWLQEQRSIRKAECDNSLRLGLERDKIHQKMFGFNSPFFYKSMWLWGFGSKHAVMALATGQPGSHKLLVWMQVTEQVLGHICQGKVSREGRGGIYGFLPRMQGLKGTYTCFKEKKTKQKRYENKSSGKQSKQKCAKLWK